MESNNSIISILVQPRTKNLYRYVLNENWHSPHVLNREKMYDFLCTFIRAPQTLQALEAIDKRVHFVVFPMKNEVHELGLQVLKQVQSMQSNLVATTYASAVGELLDSKRQTAYDSFIQTKNLKDIILATDYLSDGVYRRNENNTEK